jgi:thioredoxin-dependent peroxiredoxin
MLRRVSPSLQGALIALASLGSALCCRAQDAAPSSGSSSGPGQAGPKSVRATQVETKVANKLLAPGDTVSDFFAVAHTGERAVLTRYLQRPVLVYFCASDKAQPCTDQATAFRDAWLTLNPHLSMVLGVSPEDRLVHSAFASEHHLPFLMLADADRRVRSSFGLKDDALTGFLIGTDRKILQVFQPKTGAEHVAALQKALADLKLLQPSYPK